MSNIQYKKHYPPMLFEKDGTRAWVWIATYKSCFMEIGQGEADEKEGKPWISIYLMESGNPGKGECQEMIQLLRKDFPERKLCASAPLNPIAKHIFDKYNVDYPKEDELV